MPRPRKRAAGLVGGASLLFLIGTNVQAGWLFVLAALLLGAFVAGLAIPPLMVRGIEIDRLAPAEVFQGDEAEVSLGVANRSRGVRAGLVVDDAFLARTSMFIACVGPGERVEVTTRRVATRRGAQDSAEATLRSSAPFGVAEVRRKFSVGGRTMVLPRVERLGPLPFVDAAPTSERALHAHPRRGGGPEYLGIREYRLGDSMRHVHWPSIARHGTVMVREFERERTRRLAIIVDTSIDAGEQDTPLDACCSAAASVALAALARGHGARLLFAESGEVRALARVDGRELLTSLAELSAGGGLVFSELLGEIAPDLRGLETALLVFPSWRSNDSPALAPGIAELRRSVVRLVAIVVDAASYDPAERLALGPDGVAELARSLRDAAADVFVWGAGEPLSAALAPERSEPVR